MLAQSSAARFLPLLLAGSLASLTASCGARSGSPLPAAGAAQPARQAVAAATAMPAKRTHLYFRVAVPGRTRSNRAQHRPMPAYVSASTAKAAFVVQGQNESKPEAPQVFPCSAVCEGAVSVPVGVDLITLKLQDAKNRTLSRGITTVLAFAKNNNPLDITLDGVVAKVGLLAPATLAVVPSSQGSILFEARDADGNIIVPDGHYADAAGRPLVFDLTSSSKALRLAVTTVSAPAAAIPFTYNGKLHVGSAMITPSAHAGISTPAKFTAATIELVPGIAKRISPPLPIDVLSVTQQPMASTVASDRNAVFVVGNSGGSATALAFDTSAGTYETAYAQSAGAPFTGPPADLGPGFYGYLAFGNDLYNPDYIYPAGLSGVSQAGSTNPCNFGDPVAIVSSKTYCVTYSFSGGELYDAASNFVAYGRVAKIRVFNGSPIFVMAIGGAPGRAVVLSGSTTPVSGASAVGANVGDPTIVYYGGFNGSVKIGSVGIASFSNPIEAVVGKSQSVYVMESSRRFGAKTPRGTFETDPLPIGAVVDVTVGVNGAPMLVESDGTLDVMGL